MAAKKTTKPKKSPAKPPKDKVIDAALELASRMPWDMVTLTDIAHGAGLSLAELADMFEDKGDILAAYGRRLDRAVLERCADPDPSSSEKDRLFEILMERFDELNSHRAAIVSVLKSFMPDPKQAVISLPHLCKSMTWMLELTGVETNGLRGAARVFGLTLVYLAGLKAWMDDESQDLSVTMAAVDKNLARAEQMASYLSL